MVSTVLEQKCHKIEISLMLINVFKVAIDLFIALGMKTGPIGMALNALGQALVVYMGYQAASIKDPPGPLKDGFDQVC